MSMFAGGKIYEKLGVRRVINAMSNGTVLGGSTPPPAVLEAMEEANDQWVEMKELLEKSGEYIAATLGAESAYVTSGCAAALTLSTAACIAGTDPDRIARLPDTSEMKNEVIIQAKQRYGFDRCYTIPGGKLVIAGDDGGCTAEQLAEAIGPKTAAVAYFVQPDWDNSVLTLEKTVEVAHAHDVPVIADAASQIYPLDLFRWNAQAADLVCFGAKYFGAPHSTGVVVGKKDRVDAVAAQGFIAYHYTGRTSFGRPMKMDRQEVVGVVAAVDRWFSMNHEDRFMEQDRRTSMIQDGLKGISNARTEVVRHKRFYGSTLNLVLDTQALGKNAQQLADELDAGDPRIWINVEGDDTLAFNVHVLNDGEEQEIVERLRSLLGG